MGASPGPLTPPPGAPARLCRRPFPPYAYVPGVEPHPVTSRQGHSYGLREEPLELGGRRLPEDWTEVEEYLFGIDLFNAAFFWEAHESWEAVWHAVERQSVVGHFLQALIQSSAAVLQHHRGRMRGVRNLLERSNANLEAARQWLESRQRTDFMGVELDVWRAQLERHLAGSSPAFPFLRVDSGSAATAPLAPR